MGLFSRRCSYASRNYLIYVIERLFLKAPDGSEIGLAPTFSASKSEETETEKAEFSTQSIVISCALFISLIIGFHFLFITEVANPIKDWIYPVIYSAGISLAFLILRDKTLTKIERDRIWVMYFVAFFCDFLLGGL